MFEAIDGISIRWRALEYEGLEHVTLEASAGGCAAQGVAVGATGSVPFGLRYRLEIAGDWTPRSLRLETTDGRGVILRREPGDRWFLGDGSELAALAGCVDIDLQGSPLTNTLPIRRLRLGDGRSAEIDVAYVPFDTFQPVVFRQRYTCLKAGRLYRYENADGSFSADLPVDEYGLVMDYPALFERLPG